MDDAPETRQDLVAVRRTDVAAVLEVIDALLLAWPDDMSPAQWGTLTHASRRMHEAQPPHDRVEHVGRSTEGAPENRQDLVVVKAGWLTAGRRGRRLGPDVFVQQAWTPVLWDDAEDPDWFKAAGLTQSPPDQAEHVGRSKEGGESQWKHCRYCGGPMEMCLGAPQCIRLCLCGDS